MNKSRLLKSSSLATLAAACVTSAGWAQPASDDQIIVTATRRAASVQDVPINMAAIGENQIKEQGLNDIADVLAYVPGINTLDRGGRQGNPLIVRGLNVDPIGGGDQSNGSGGTVATYIGEVPVYVDLKLNDLERVEVLLGPQGTLYGAGTLGGAIRYIPKKPDFDGDQLSVRGGAYKYKESGDVSAEGGVTVNKSLGDNFALRGSFDYQSDSGFIDYPFIVQEPGVSEPDPDLNDPAARAANFAPRKDLDGEETISGRIAARWAPVDSFDATLTYYFQNADIEGRRASSARSLAQAGRYEIAMRVPEPAERNNNLLALEVVADLGFAELTSATGYSRYNDKKQRDHTDFLISLEYSYELFPTFTAFTADRAKEKRFNEEIRLVSTTTGPLSWIIGAFFNRYETARTSSEFTPGYANFIGVPRLDDLEYNEQFHSKLVETAVYGEIGYDITDRWTVTVGGRYYYYDRKDFSEISFPLAGDIDFVAPTIDEVFKTDFQAGKGQSANGGLFKVNTSYKATDDILVYATVSQGYRIGNSNGIDACPEFDPLAPNVQKLCALLPGQLFFPGGADNVSLRDETQYSPDKTLNYELGAKSVWLDGALILNGAIYYIDWTDPQVGGATVNASIPITVNAEGAASKGVELSGDLRATDNFRIRGNFSYTKSELTDVVPGLIPTFTPPGFATFFEDGQDGDRLPGSPQTQFSIFASYNLPLSHDRSLTYNFGYSHQSDLLTQVGGKGGSLTLDGFGIANASIVYDAGNWQATLFANNLFNEYAETGARATPLYNQVINDANIRFFYTNIAPPRAFGVRFNWDIVR